MASLLWSWYLTWTDTSHIYETCIVHVMDEEENALSSCSEPQVRAGHSGRVVLHKDSQGFRSLYLFSPQLQGQVRVPDTLASTWWKRKDALVNSLLSKSVSLDSVLLGNQPPCLTITSKLQEVT